MVIACANDVRNDTGNLRLARGTWRDSLQESIRSMNKKSIIGVGLLAFLIAGGIFFFQTHSLTRHLTETPPQKIELHSGSNNLTFSVVQGSYLLRIGTSEMEPATFRFRVKGKITSASGTQLIDEIYEPTDEILSKKVNGGYIAKNIDIKEKKGIVSVQIDAMCPEKELLVCLFQGIK